MHFRTALTMRDVKYINSLFECLLTILYCLNYAGCKVTFRDPPSWKILKYCLNYAGCKVYLSKPSSLQINTYCLNYAGCKERLEVSFCSTGL